MGGTDYKIKIKFFVQLIKSREKKVWSKNM